ncbi:MAG: thiosulfate oxidation carrier protein SoxY [Gallionella sp.]|nr:thiosulfate oxidation carrier protein SoxY [Gallionella sp.]
MHKSEVDLERRKALKAGGGIGLLGLLVAAGLIRPGIASAASNRAAFEAKTMDEALNALGVVISENSLAIQLGAPEVAENGAVVPITVESTLSRTEQICILVNKNPTILAANFLVPEGTEGFITTRIRMAETSSVIALVKANGKFYRASREVKVTAGGC